MKRILAARSNQKIVKRSFLFCVLLSFSTTLFAQGPTITSFSPASGAAGTLVTINGTNLGTPTAFSIGGVTALVINNTGTVLTGFVMPGAVTGAISLTTGNGTAISSGNFMVTPTLYSGVQQGGKLVGTGNTGPASQGCTVSISADGNTAIVGGYQDNSSQGAAWVYTRSGGAWSQQGGKLVGTGNTGAAFQGYSVSISADGNTAIEGGLVDNNYLGAAWVFIRNGSAWSQQGGKLVGTGNTGAAEQGRAVSLSADGNTAMVGGYADNGGQGAAWVYTRSDGVWSQQGGKLVGTGNKGAAGQGWSIALSADGNTAVVGGPGDFSIQGAAWVYTRSGGAWSQQGGKLVGTGNTEPARQGGSVSISADGNTAMVGGFSDNNIRGAAWVYTRSGGVWNQQGGKLVGTGNTGLAEQGVSVALSADGNTALVGGPGDNKGLGAAWVYTRSGGAWGQQGGKLVGTGGIGAAQQGLSVSLSADGNTAMVGGYADNSQQGAAWVFGPNVDLVSLKVGGGSHLSPYFAPMVTSYIDSVAYNHLAVTITPTANDTLAIITVNGTTIVSGATSASIPLNEGSNTITTVITAEDGITTKTYTVNVFRAFSSDANLSFMQPTAGMMSPYFTPAITGYTDTVNFTNLGTHITPVVRHPLATIKVNGLPVASGSLSQLIPLNEGPNTVTAVVTAADGFTTKTFTIAVFRRFSTNANLSWLQANSGTLSPAFSPTVTSYADEVNSSVASIKIAPFVTDLLATITVDGTTVASGTRSPAIALVVGPNIITIIVTAPDGTTNNTYTLTVTRDAPPPHALKVAFQSTGVEVTTIKPLRIADDGLLVHQGVSPNGDGVNDFLTIENIEQYPDNKLSIMNRNGQLIFEAKGYDNSSKVFDGHSNKNGQMQLPGTYFYQLDYAVKGIIKHKTGFLVLKY